MTLLAKILDIRGSLRVSIVWGSPMALSMRSAAVAYANGLLLHSARYSSSESSSSRVRSKRAAKWLITSMLTSRIWSACDEGATLVTALGSSDEVRPVAWAHGLHQSFPCVSAQCVIQASLNSAGREARR